MGDTFAKSIRIDSSTAYLTVITELFPDFSANIDENNSRQYWPVSVHNAQKQTTDNELIKQNSLKCNFQIFDLRNKGRYCGMFAQFKNCEDRRERLCKHASC
jgi:hypothetical protein